MNKKKDSFSFIFRCCCRFYCFGFLFLVLFFMFFFSFLLEFHWFCSSLPLTRNIFTGHERHCSRLIVVKFSRCLELFLFVFFFAFFISSMSFELTAIRTRLSSHFLRFYISTLYQRNVFSESIRNYKYLCCVFFHSLRLLFFLLCFFFFLLFFARCKQFLHSQRKIK